MTGEPRPVEEIRADIARQRHREVLARLAAADQENAELRAQLRDASDFNRGNCERANRAEMHADGLRRIRDKALAENAELRGEVGRARALCDRYGIVSLDDALAELDGARTEADEARADLRREQDAMATLYGGFAAAAEARDHAEAQVLIQNGYTNRAATAAGLEQQRADAAEARLEAVRAVCDRRMGEIDLALRQLRIGDASNGVGHLRRELAALSAAPQPEPNDSDPEWDRAKADIGRSLAETFAEHTRAREQMPPASDEPARPPDLMAALRATVEAAKERRTSRADHNCVPEGCSECRPECRHCNGSGNAHTFDGDDVGICGTCHGTGSAAGGGL